MRSSRETGRADVTPAAAGASLAPRTLLEAIPECLLLVDTDGRVLYANLPAEALTGFTRQELAGKAAELLIATELLDRGALTEVPSVCRRADGSQVPVTVTVTPILDDGPASAVILLRDTAEGEADRRARFEAEAKYRSLVEQIPGVVYLDPVDEDGVSIYVSPQVETLLGVTPGEWLADPWSWSHHLDPRDSARVWETYLHSYHTHTPLEHEYRMVHEDGSVRWVLELANPIDDSQGRPWLIQGVIFDITERKEAEERALYLAYHDELSGLPNRGRFQELVQEAVEDASRSGGSVGVAMIDLDDFGFINESLGYAAGNAVLVQLAERLRTWTPEGATVARPGGDKYLVLLPSLPANDQAVEALDATVATIYAGLLDPFDLTGVDLVMTACMGLSLLPHDAEDAHALMRNADAALHTAKGRGAGSSLRYARSGHDPKERLRAIARLRRAVDERRWTLHYQPVVDLRAGTVTGVEGLIRWRDLDGHMIPPGEFIPLAEELGLIEPIGDWVIEEVAAQQGRWASEGLGLSTGFNLSPRQFRASGLAERILRGLGEANVDPHSIVVEVTESTAMADAERTQTILTSMHDAGLQVALDDFGTGYSSLSRLRYMPVDILKIDRSFVHHVDTDLALAGMVRAMIQLAQTLDMTSLAEGIETPGELAFLRANGCQLGQGFLMSGPVPPSEIPALVARRGGLFP
jgi:diguanylate cyclase (GGDEF)-like protein/PAS domain S-box-containing protein